MLVLLSATTSAPTCSSINGWLNCTLTVAAGVWDIGFRNISFRTRLYNGMPNGPVLRARPGDRVRILLQNRLGAAGDRSACEDRLAGYRGPNTTNLHIHGIFETPAHDDTFACVGPFEDKQYAYEIDRRTGSSLLWYHPHFDGSSAMHLYGGMGGVFDIVDQAQEAAYGLDFAEDATVRLCLTVLNFDPTSSDYLGAFLANGGEGVGKSELPLSLVNPTSFTGIVVTVNGVASAPVRRIAVGTWAKLKIVNAASASSNNAILGFDAGSDACELRVLAYDGAYISGRPRVQRAVIVPAGGRAVLAVRCQALGRFSFGTLSGQLPFGTMGQVMPAEQPVLVLDVGPAAIGRLADGPTAVGISTLPERLPGPPQFYPDLRSAKPDGFNSVRLSNAAGDNNVNGWPYNGSVSYTMPHGSVQEWVISGGEGVGLQKQHPYHQHMSHFQIVASSIDTGGLVALGDYRDTVPLYADLNFTIRFIAPFTGRMMVHCHVLKHEDRGMMTLAEVVR